MEGHTGHESLHPVTGKGAMGKMGRYGSSVPSIVASGYCVRFDMESVPDPWSQVLEVSKNALITSLSKHLT